MSERIEQLLGAGHDVRLGKRVHLDLTVKVRPAWRRDDSLLDRLGIEP